MTKQSKSISIELSFRNSFEYLKLAVGHQRDDKLMHSFMCLYVYTELERERGGEVIVASILMETL